jgi:hypothetical protein
MQDTLRKLFQMFYPLSSAERRRWAEVLSSSEQGYLSSLEKEATSWGLQQTVRDGAAVWSNSNGQELLLLFRLEDPGDLEVVRRMYEVISAHDAPLAYAFVRQVPDGAGTWDIFHMSRLTYLAHCNRVSGPGSECDQTEEG